MMHVTSEDIDKLKRKLGYKGCRNCKNQIEPFRRCEWAERKEDMTIHFICPRWEKTDDGK